MRDAGRFCPTDYHYPASVMRREPELDADALYVVGGLYGNRLALDVIEAMVVAERGRTAIAFNGDFHWFDALPEHFAEINRRVSAHAALRGNVETELGRTLDVGAGCGCAYPESVDDATVARSNRILERVRGCVDVLPAIREQLATLPMTLVASVGPLRVGVVHGDAEALAGWRFAHDALDAPAARAWLEAMRMASEVDVYASSHTCLPVLRDFELRAGRLTIINNGAAGMPNFGGTGHGVLTRIGRDPSPYPPLYGVQRDGVHIDALAVAYDQRRWLSEFVTIWPPGSPAYDSYFHRIVDGPPFLQSEALSGSVAPVARRGVAA